MSKDVAGREAALRAAVVENKWATICTANALPIIDHHKARAKRAEAALREARERLTDTCAAMEYWAGCDESVTPDIATSEIMSAGGAFPAHAYDEARATLAALDGEII